MKGSDFAMCQTYPITHAIDTDKSGSLKKISAFSENRSCRRIEFRVSDISVYVKSRDLNVEF
jgi:hypothetical protein